MKNNKISYSDAEKEILTLKAIIESINSMVNREVLSLYHNDPISEIRFPDSTYQKFFNIILLDFLSSKIYGVSKTCMGALQDIATSPQHGTSVDSLKGATEKFQKWLDQDVIFEHDDKTRQLWFSTINQKIVLKITRAEFISICGNISKHNPFVLDRQAKEIQKIFARNEIPLEQTEALLCIEEFYEQFHDDLFLYHSGTIAEFLNNLRLEIYEYLQPLYDKSIENLDERQKKLQYRYNVPSNIKNEYIKKIFYNLMGNVRSEPCMPRFEITKHLKTRY